MADLNLEQGLAVLDGRTRWVKLLIAAYVVASLAVVAGQLGEIAGSVDLEAEDGNLAVQMIVSLAYLALSVVFIASIVLVAMWIYRAHANVRTAGITLEVTPGWAVGWFFVPIANLFKPFQAMRELWKASHREAGGYTSDADPKLTIWWGFWVVGNILSNISLRFDVTAGEGAANTSLLLDTVSTLLLIVAAWFLLRIVTAVNLAQRSMVGLATTFA